MKRTEIKYCGMRTRESLAYALKLGVNYVGIVVDYPKSPRSVKLNAFLEIAKWLQNKKGKCKLVAVTVDMPLKNLNKLIESGLADVIQLHGDEKSEYIKQIKGIEVWKAWSGKSKGDVLKVAKLVDKILLDSGNAVEKATDKSGEFDAFGLYKELKKKGVAVIVSGGINSENVEMYVEKLKPEIIDVSRGIEISPGKKSKAKMKLLVNAVKDYQR